MTRSEARRLRRTRTLEEAHAMADESDARARAHKARVSVKRKPGREEKASEREARRQRTANVRVEVFKRDEGKCVVCGAEATDMHHLVYGSGMRRVLESGKTCAAVCRWHHEEAHRGGWATLESLQIWARTNGYTFAADAIVRRMDKIRALGAQREVRT